MLFNTFNYLTFLLFIFPVYWLLNRNLKAQNTFILLCSYFFYGCWDYRFLFLLIFSTYLDFFTGKKIYESESKSLKKMWLIISVGINLGFLGFFKYYNFFADQAATLIELMGFRANIWTLKLILPVGISFYTFHGLSYVFDIYNDKFKPRESFFDYAVFVCFFPLLVAGPIERASHLLPQVERKRVFNYSTAILGLRQILWGLFKKVVIADNCATHANKIFNDYQHYNGSTLLVGAVFFAFQIYGDFSGYSDIALGTARLFGFELLKNFSYPYFSRDIAEFWRRWHMSLSSWFRDYLYIPLGGSKVSKLKQVRNTFIIFLVSGFWHGANWTFIFWGFLNAVYFLPLLLANKNRSNMGFVDEGSLQQKLTDGVKILITFFMVTLAWIFFRAKTLYQAFDYVYRVFAKGLLSRPAILPWELLALIVFFMMVEWRGRHYDFALAGFGQKQPAVMRYSFYYVVLLLLFVYACKNQEFIYFQF